MTELEAVTLDLFGTLVDFDIWRHEPPLVERLLEDTEAEPSGKLDPQRVLELWVRESLTERAKTPFRSVRTSLEIGAARMGEQLGLGPGLEPDPTVWARALEDLWAARPLAPGVPAALDRLEAEGFALAIVTNLDAHVLERVLANTGLGARIDIAVCSEHARAYKPHPRPFRMALDALGVGPDEAVHAGNSPGEDRAGARATGMGCLLVDPGAAALGAVEPEGDR